MRNEDLLRQASLDAERVKRLSVQARENLNRETDWQGSRLRGYEPRSENRVNAA